MNRGRGRCTLLACCWHNGDTLGSSAGTGNGEDTSVARVRSGGDAAFSRLGMVRAFAEEEDYVRAGRAAGSGGAGRTGSGAAWCRVIYGCGL